MATYYRTPWKDGEPSDYASVNPHKRGGPRRFGRPSFTSNRPQRGGPGRAGGFNRGRGGSRGRNNPGEQIDVSRFINKAQPIAEAAPYVPTHQFLDFPLHERVQKNLADKGYLVPTPIQDQAIPAVLDGRDIVGL